MNNIRNQKGVNFDELLLTVLLAILALLTGKPNRE